MKYRCSVTYIVCLKCIDKNYHAPRNEICHTRSRQEHMYYNVFRRIPHGGRHSSSVILSEHLEPISKIRGLLIWMWDICYERNGPCPVT